MCRIIDIVYHYCGFCGNILDLIRYCTDEAVASLCGDLCLRIENRITEEESFDLFCQTCFYTSELRKQYQAGELTSEGMEKMIADISRGRAKAPTTSIPGEEDLEISAGVKRDHADDIDDIVATKKRKT